MTATYDINGPGEKFALGIGMPWVSNGVWPIPIARAMLEAEAKSSADELIQHTACLEVSRGFTQMG